MAEDIGRISITPNVTSRDRTLNKPYGGKAPQPIISNEEFKLLLQGLLEEKELEKLKLPEIHFIIKLKEPYEDEKALFPILEGKGIRIVQIIDSYSLLVVAKKEDLNAIFKQKKTSAEILGRIRYLGLINPNEKLGASIKALLKDANEKTTIPVKILIPKNANFESLKSYTDAVKSIIKTAQYSTYGNSFRAKCTPKQIDEISRLPFVHTISADSGTQGQSAASASTPVLAELDRTTDALPGICILDTGVGKPLSKFCELDNIDKTSKFDEDEEHHGTKVASVALFGSELTEGSTTKLKPTANVISVKICSDHNEGPTAIEDVLAEAIRRHKAKTKIFSISFCYGDGIDPQNRLSIAQSIDKLIFDENVIIINSAGNVHDTLPVKRSKNVMPILSPSDSHLIMAVGCGDQDRTKFHVSGLSRYGRSAYFLNKTNDKRCFFKPDVFTHAGDIDARKPGTLASYLNPNVRVLDANGAICDACGTSFAAPLVANKLAQISHQHRGRKTSEIFKTMLASRCKIIGDKERSVLFLPPATNVSRHNDAVYLDFDHINVPAVQVKKDKKTKSVSCLQISIPIDERIESIDLFTAHSTARSDFDPTRHMTKLTVQAAIAGSKHNENRKLGNVNDYAAFTYGRYICGPTKKGKWVFSFHLESNWLSKKELAELQSRAAVSFRLNIKRKFLPQLKEIYDMVRGHLSTTTRSQDQPVEDRMAAVGQVAIKA